MMRSPVERITMIRKRPKAERNTAHQKNGESFEDEGTEKPTLPPSGTLILDATCAPQNIRFPTDTSLLNEARENAEEIIDILHEAGLTEGKKPRIYREKARRNTTAFEKAEEVEEANTSNARQAI